MANFDSGVSGYVVAKTIITVEFPVDFKGNADVSCKQCDYYNKNSNRCLLNHKVPAYPNTNIGQECPL